VEVQGCGPGALWQHPLVGLTKGLAQCLPQHPIGLESGQGLRLGAGQGPAMGGRGGVEILQAEGSGIQLALQAIKPGGEHGGGQKVGVAVAIGEAQLKPLPVWHAHQVGAVVGAPADPGRAPGGT